MLVYHGTAINAVESIIKYGPELKLRHYTNQKRKCFCTTTDFSIATLFAVRKTSAEDYLKGLLTGVVLEFDLTGKPIKDYDSAVDRTCAQDEKEIVVYNLKKLVLQGIWRHDGKWYRNDKIK